MQHGELGNLSLRRHTLNADDDWLVLSVCQRFESGLRQLQLVAMQRIMDSRIFCCRSAEPAITQLWFMRLHLVGWKSVDSRTFFN